MGQESVPVDLLNPGQVFACLGLLEAAESLLGSASAMFDWSHATDVRFIVETPKSKTPIAAVLQFLSEATVLAMEPADPQVMEASFSDGKWQDLPLMRVDPELVYPQPRPETPATLVAALRRGADTIVIDSWGDATSRDNVKFWAGSGGYPGAAFVRDALQAAAGVDGGIEAALADPFALATPQSSSLRLDWRRDYVPLDVGFSLNVHNNKIVPLGYPLVEVLAVIGLSHARPLRPERRNKLAYRYAIIGGELLGPVLHRAALGCASLPFSTRSFSMVLGWPGQVGQARCITSVTEEPSQ